MKYEYVSPDAVVISDSYDDVIRTSALEGDNEVPLFPTNPNPDQDLENDWSGFH